jgi:AsmA protein
MEFSSTSIAGMVAGSLDVAGARPLLHGRIDADQLDLGALLAGAGIGWLGGAGSLSLSLDGPINDLAGSGELDLARGQLRGADLVALPGRAGMSGGVMEFSALSDRFTLGAGTVRTDALRLMAGTVPIDGAGTIDLGQRTLDYRLTVHRPDAPAAQVEISGPWDAPSFARR